jgi:hypothetical protein
MAPKIGSIYKNQFGILRVTDFEENKTFQLAKENADYMSGVSISKSTEEGERN